MAIKRLENRRSKPLLTEHKVAFALLLFLGIGGIVFGYKSFGASLARPINAQLASLYAEGTFLTSTEREELSLEEAADWLDKKNVWSFGFFEAVRGWGPQKVVDDAIATWQALNLISDFQI